jgi:RNA polymerase sigma-70 factor (ECF subfamily)
MLRDSELARDATQDVFLKLLGDARLEKRASNPVPWIYNVSTCHCLDVLRAQARQREKEQTSTEAARATDLVGDRQLALRVLSRFDDKTQAIAVGILVAGMEQEELASALGITRQTVARRLDRFLTDAKKYASRSAE